MVYCCVAKNTGQSQCRQEERHNDNFTHEKHTALLIPAETTICQIQAIMFCFNGPTGTKMKLIICSKEHGPLYTGFETGSGHTGSSHLKINISRSDLDWIVCDAKFGIVQYGMMHAHCNVGSS